MTTYYGILGVPATATKAEIRHAYLRLCGLYHPDKSVGVNPAVKSLIEEKFKDIREAYDTLSQHRAEYDNALRTAAATPPPQRPPTQSQAPSRRRSRPYVSSPPPYVPPPPCSTCGSYEHFRKSRRWNLCDSITTATVAKREDEAILERPRNISPWEPRPCLHCGETLRVPLGYLGQPVYCCRECALGTEPKREKCGECGRDFFRPLDYSTDGDPPFQFPDYLSRLFYVPLTSSSGATGPARGKNVGWNSNTELLYFRLLPGWEKFWNPILPGWVQVQGPIRVDGHCYTTIWVPRCPSDGRYSGSNEYFYCEAHRSVCERSDHEETP
jgi:hypothetical protein